MPCTDVVLLNGVSGTLELSKVNNYCITYMCNNVFKIHTYSNLCYFTVTAQQGPGMVIAHPGHHVELLCTVTPFEYQTAAWIIDDGTLYTSQQLHNGILTGYSSNGSNLIIENIMMNDDRNNTEYSCGIISSKVSNPTVPDIINESDTTILYIAGEY